MKNVFEWLLFSGMSIVCAIIIYIGFRVFKTPLEMSTLFGCIIISTGVILEGFNCLTLSLLLKTSSSSENETLVQYRQKSNDFPWV